MAKHNPDGFCRHINDVTLGILKRHDWNEERAREELGREIQRRWRSDRAFRSAATHSLETIAFNYAREKHNREMRREPRFEPRGGGVESRFTRTAGAQRSQVGSDSQNESDSAPPPPNGGSGDSHLRAESHPSGDPAAATPSPAAEPKRVMSATQVVAPPAGTDSSAPESNMGEKAKIRLAPAADAPIDRIRRAGTDYYRQTIYVPRLGRSKPLAECDAADCDSKERHFFERTGGDGVEYMRWRLRAEMLRRLKAANLGDIEERALREIDAVSESSRQSIQKRIAQCLPQAK